MLTFIEISPSGRGRQLPDLSFSINHKKDKSGMTNYRITFSQEMSLLVAGKKIRLALNSYTDEVFFVFHETEGMHIQYSGAKGINATVSSKDFVFKTASFLKIDTKEYFRQIWSLVPMKEGAFKIGKRIE